MCDVYIPHKWCSFLVLNKNSEMSILGFELASHAFPSHMSQRRPSRLHFISRSEQLIFDNRDRLCHLLKLIFSILAVLIVEIVGSEDFHLNLIIGLAHAPQFALRAPLALL